MCSVAVRLPHRLSALALLAGVLLMASGCGGHYVARGTALYEDARYVEAAEVFEQTEERLANSSSSEQARFGLYRGATFLKLGDAAHAARWLGYARSIVKSAPNALDEADLQLLDSSLKALGRGAPSEPAPRLDSQLATAPTDSEAAQSP